MTWLNQRSQRSNQPIDLIWSSPTKDIDSYVESTHHFSIHNFRGVENHPHKIIWYLAETKIFTVNASFLSTTFEKSLLRRSVSMKAALPMDICVDSLGRLVCVLCCRKEYARDARTCLAPSTSLSFRDEQQMGFLSILHSTSTTGSTLCQRQHTPLHTNWITSITSITDS